MQGEGYRKKGFTLIELLVVIAIIALLASIVSVALLSTRAKARDAKRLEELHQIANALDLYYNDTGHYPIATSWVTECFTAGNNWIPNGSDYTWNTKYISVMPRDPLENCGSGTQRAYAYWSNGTNYQLTGQLESTSTLPGGGGGSGQITYANGDVVTTDPTAPLTVALSSSITDPTNQTSIPISAIFSQGVVDFTQFVVSITNGSFVGSISSGVSSLFSFFVTPSSNGLVTVTINSGAVHDQSGGSNSAGQFTITYDSSRPHVALSPDPLAGTMHGAFSVQVSLTIPVVDIGASSFSVSNGSASGLTMVAPLNGLYYSVTITPAAPGAVSVSMQDSAVHSSAGNASVVSNTLTTTYAP